MKLKRITIHNIASIADAEIDFVASPLADTPLFLIAGPTGAGKSIILDSVCLALYARAPRLTRFKTDEKYEDSTLVLNLVSLGARAKRKTTAMWEWTPTGS